MEETRNNSFDAATVAFCAFFQRRGFRFCLLRFLSCGLLAFAQSENFTIFAQDSLSFIDALPSTGESLVILCLGLLLFLLRFSATVQLSSSVFVLAIISQSLPFLHFWTVCVRLSYNLAVRVG